MSGRAGRRGLDDKGIVILMIDQKVSPSVVKDMVQGKADPINSAFHLTYNMVSGKLCFSLLLFLFFTDNDLLLESFTPRLYIIIFYCKVVWKKWLLRNKAACCILAYSIYLYCCSVCYCIFLMRLRYFLSFDPTGRCHSEHLRGLLNFVLKTMLYLSELFPSLQVLNLLRVEEINPEYMLERSFFQFQNQAAIPDLIEST